MIIKKPYIFLIKHFRQIHIFLLLMGLFIYIKHTSLVTFIRDFMEYTAYDPTTDPISKYIPFWYLLIVLIMGLLSLALLVLLKQKRKPWKLYLIPTITYLIIFIVDLLIKTYFVGYSGGLDRASISLFRDLSYLTLITQLPIFIVYLMRVLGLNLKHFDFKLDEEYLEISDEDKEDLEININFDKEGVFRVFRRLWRNIGYVYQEHKLIINAIFTLIGIIILYRTYVFIFITNKSYKQNDTYNVNGYSIVVKDAYYTNRDGKGDIIEKNRGFGDTFKSTIYKKEETMSLDSAEITKEVDYDRLVCSAYNDCETQSEIKQSPDGKSILSLEFGTEEVEGNDLNSICTKYGKIQYGDGKDTKTMSLKSAVSGKYLGKYAYIELPDKVAESKTINFILTIRNNRYVYKIR